ncbi:MAG TPA: hypothetical protein VK116_02185, partial [Planctomycetota bacterium]|nr:hypothetical protein [Planctomycetota bacterium]
GDKQLYIQLGTSGSRDEANVEVLVGFEVEPRGPGPLVLPRAMLEVPLRTGRTRRVRDFFGTREVPETRSYPAISEEIEIEVLPLPEDGRPAGFSGAVGRYSIEVTTEDTKVAPFDPIRLRVTIRGQGFLDDLTLPLWHEVESLKKDFEFSTDSDPGELKGRAKVFTHVARARHSGITEIPPLPFPFYDPAKGGYETAWSTAIPIEVSETSRVSIEDSIVRAPSVGDRRPRAAEPAVKLQGVAANYPTVGTIRRFPDARALIRSTPFVLVCAVPPGILVAAALGLVIARRPREARARDRALKEARSRIRAARGSLETTSSAYGDYFRERFGLPQGELDPRELDTALANEGVSEETR